MKYRPAAFRGGLTTPTLALILICSIWMIPDRVPTVGKGFFFSFQCVLLIFLWGKIIHPLSLAAQDLKTIIQEESPLPISVEGVSGRENASLTPKRFWILNEWRRRRELMIRLYPPSVVGILTGGVCHQINNLLNNIILTMDTLMEENAALSADERGLLYRDILTETERAGELSVDLLRCSRSFAPQEDEISIIDLIDRVLRLLRNECKIHRIKIERQVTPQIPSLRADPNALSWALIHLLLNAFEAMPEGGKVEITVSFLGNILQIDVADEGEGIPAAERDRIFLPFFTTKRGKVGLGLTISRELMEKMGGRIEVRSRKGGGAVFSLQCPSGKRATSQRVSTDVPGE